MKTAKEILTQITCNGMRELTEERAEQAMRYYAEEAIREAAEKASIEEYYYDADGKKEHISSMNHRYIGGRHMSVNKEFILDIIKELK